MRDGQILADKKVFKSSQPISGAKFDNDIDEILKSGLNNFQQQYILRSPDIFRDIENFEVHPNNVEFTVGDERPISSSKQQVKSINELPNFLNDKHLSHIPNYRFMPPVNKPRFNFQEGEPLGDYDKIQPDEFKTFDDVKVELDRFDQKGYSELVSFQETTEENNIFSQVFEISGGRVTKLDIIDFGTFPSQENESDKHVFFAGKLFTDDRGVRSFVRIFTIVFE